MPLFNINGQWVEAADEASAMRVFQPEPQVQVPPEIQLAVQAAEAFPQGDVSQLRTPGFGTKMQEGFLSNDPAEQLAFYQEKYPDRDVRQLMLGGEPYVASQNPDNYEVEFANLPGAGAEDVASALGGAALPVLAGVGTALSGGGALPLMAVGAGSELLAEGAQALYGSQREPTANWATRAAISGAAELPGATLATGGTMLANQAMNRGTGAAAKNRMVQAMQTGQDAGLYPIAWQNHQFTQDPVYKRMANQSMQLSPEMQARASNQMGDVRYAGQAAIPPAELPPDQVVGDMMARTYQRGMVLPPNATEAGKNVAGMVDQGRTLLKGDMTQAYKNLDEVYKAEEPVFDLTETVRLAQPRKVNLKDVEGNPINVAAAPTSELAGIMKDISKLNPVQENFKGVKEIRSRLGSLLELPPVKLAESGIDIGQVKQLYGQLSEDMMTNTGSRAFEDAARAAGQTAKRYYDVYDVTQIKDAINKADAGQLNHLYKSIADDPASLETGFTDVLSLAKPSNIREFRGGITRSILSADDPLAALQKWKRESGDGYEWLMRDPSVKDMTEQMVRARKEMDNSFFRKAWEQDTMRSGFAGEALQQEATDAASSRNFLKEMGGKGSEGHEAVRTAIWENAINNSRAFNEAGGVEALDPKLLRKEIKKMKDNRWWSEILTVQDKAKLEGLEGYAETSWQKGSGSDGLMMAGLVGKLRSSQVGAAVAEISSSRWIARAMMSEKWNKNALLNAAKRAGNAQTKQAFSGRWPRAVATVIANTAEMGKILEEEEQLKAP